jgi:hypothetical protein
MLIAFVTAEIVSVYVVAYSFPRGPNVLVIVNVNVPAFVGTPEIVAVEALKLNPGGNCPSVS